MEYTRKKLESHNIYALRVIGKEQGVKKPSALRKKDLIEQILAVQCGEKEPFYSNRGRKFLTNFVLGEDDKIVIKNQKKLSQKQIDIDELLEHIKKFMLKYC